MRSFRNWFRKLVGG